MRILLIRHGQTDSNAGGILQGHLPVPLNDVGHEQARRLADRLRRHAPPVDALISSDLRRAVETAAPLEQALGLSADYDAVWRERGFGSFEGRTIGDTEIWRAASGTLDPPGAEPIPALRDRVATALEAVVRRHAARRCVAIVTHGGVVRTVLQLFADGRLMLTAGHTQPDVSPIANASIAHLSVVSDEDGEVSWRIDRVNDTDHLNTAETVAVDTV